MESQGMPQPPSLRVLMLPLGAHGHISPFLELATSLTRHNVFVYLCSSSVNLHSINSSPAMASPLIEPIELKLSDHLPLHTTKNLPNRLMPTLKVTFDTAQTAFGRLLDNLSPDLIIYDFMQPWAPIVAGERNIPAVLFFANAASATTLFYHHLKNPTEPLPFPTLRFEGREREVSVKMLSMIGYDQTDGDRFLKSIERTAGLIAYRSFREIEAKYLDYLPSLLGKEVVPVGALVSDVCEEEGWQDQHKVAAWLNNQPPASVVFISLGSEYFMTKEEMEEMTCGLELSRFRFIWVVRFKVSELSIAAGGESAAKFPSGLSERLQDGERGIIIEGWAPQKKILSHPSVGGFLTHCGWSSVCEAMKFGVPMIALPLQNDQLVNAALAVELGFAVKVKTTAVFNKRLKESVNQFKGEDVASCFKEVMAGEGGNGVRKRAKEMAEIMAGKGDEEIEMFVEKMVGLVKARARVSSVGTK